VPARGLPQGSCYRRLAPLVNELTVHYSNGPDDRSVKLALGYVTAATSGC
jgi:hypothetical protein